jgi:signal transduction histidine kinase
MQLDAVSKASSRVESDVLLKDISKLLLEIMQGTRNLIFELSSPIMNEMGLSAAISDWLEEYVEDRYGLETELVDTAGNVNLDNDLRAILFRNVRELFTNIIKHANAKRVTVMLKTVADDLQISIIDDGNGFDLEQVQSVGNAGGGFGLFSIGERMFDLDGTLEIITKPGEGCRVIMSVPMDSDNSGKDS